MSDFVPNSRNLRKVLIFFFHSKKTVAEAHRELQKIYGDAALSETTCRDWFRHLKDGDFDVDDRPRQARPKAFEDADVIYYELLIHCSNPKRRKSGDCPVMLLRRGLGRIDAFEPSTAQKTVTIRAEARKSDSTA